MLSLTIQGLTFTVINLIVLFLLMKKFLVGPVMGIIEKRQALIEEQFSSARNAENTALELKQQYEISIKDAGAKADEMIESARGNASTEYERIVKDADEKAVKIISDAEKTIRMDREKTLREMESEIAGLAMIAAAKIVSEQSNDSRNQSLYSDFIKKAGGTHDTDRN